MNLEDSAVRCNENRETAILLGTFEGTAFYVPMQAKGLRVEMSLEAGFFRAFNLLLGTTPAHAAAEYLKTYQGRSALAEQALTAVKLGNPIVFEIQEITMGTNDVKAAGAAVDKAVEKVAAPGAAEKAAGKAPAKKGVIAKAVSKAVKKAAAKAPAKAKALKAEKPQYAGKKYKVLIKENPCRPETWSNFMLQAIMDNKECDAAQTKIDRNKAYGTASDAPRKADFGWAVKKGYISAPA